MVPTQIMQKNLFNQLEVPTTKSSLKVNGQKQPYDKFGQVFNQAIQQNHQESKSSSLNTDVEDVALKSVLEANSVEELLDLLGLEKEDELLYISFSIEQVAELLQINPEQLQDLLAQLSVDSTNGNDIWSILEQAPMLLEKLFENVQNESTLSEQQQLQLAQFLKLAQLLGQQQDTIYQQQFTLNQLSGSLDTFLTQLSQMAASQQQTTTPIIEKYTMTTIQQIVQPVNPEQKVESMNSSAQTNNESLFQQNAQSNNVKTVNVVLPANPASRGEELAKEIQNLLNRSQVSNNQGTLKLMLKLFPENLGQIRIEIVQQNGVMTARLLASTAAGKELLDSNLNQLKATFAAQNIQMDRLDVTQALHETDKNSRDQNMFNNFFNKQSKEETQEDTDEQSEEIKSFDQYLEEEVQ